MYMHAMLVKKKLHDSKDDIACRIDHKEVFINKIDIGLIQNLFLLIKLHIHFAINNFNVHQILISVHQVVNSRKMY